ncbi:Transposon Tf2-8 polyprotein [Vitis vinifera]|uniref:Transposon Tf2-8 polyprotein n=1 Tax=Vitis vinifera TaxID=29760 RepID=A0A438I263_VITVI|nr:Transposon Tf2-8 polyprotein [Vitis vinifera]
MVCSCKRPEKLFIAGNSRCEMGICEILPGLSDGQDQGKKAVGLLQPLHIPERPWESISMDFITGFPKVRDFKSIFVVADRLSKYIVFISTPDACPAEETTKLFFSNVVKHFGLPNDIVSDRDARFTGRFWVELFKLLDSELKFSTTNHPQTNEQTERINALLEEYLMSSATGMSPFELANGVQPRMPLEVAKQKARGNSPAAYKMAQSRPLEFQVGDKVLLKLTPQIWKKINSKTRLRGLIPKYDGPFEVIKRVGQVAYMLKLPERLKLYPTFHVSFLKPYHEDLDADKRAPSLWKETLEAEATWERDVTLWQFETAVQAYWQTKSTRASTSAGGDGFCQSLSHLTLPWRKWPHG